jgi:hypothetical protein
MTSAQHVTHTTRPRTLEPGLSALIAEFILRPAAVMALRIRAQRRDTYALPADNPRADNTRADNTTAG